MNDRELLLEKLAAGRDELLAAVEGTTEAEAAATPEGGGWSALQCVEHVATVDTRVLRRMQHDSTAVGAEMSREREPMLYDLIAARGRKVEAPEMVHPTGRYASLAEAVRGFVTARERTMRWVKDSEGDLRLRSVEHPAFGVVSVHEMVLIAAAHAARHARQIVEGRGAK